MNNITYNYNKIQGISLKKIFTIDNLKLFFKKYKIFFNEFDTNHLKHIKKSLNAFLKCKDPTFGKVIFTCPICNIKTYRPITCKSRFCTCCGMI